MKKKELMSTDVVAIEMVTETIGRMFGRKVKPKSMSVELLGQEPCNPPFEWLTSMRQSLPEIDYLNAESGYRGNEWKRIVVTVHAAFEYSGGQLSPKFDCQIFKLGGMIYPYAIALRTPNREGVPRVIRYEWMRSFSEPVQSGVADPANFADHIVLS